MTPHPMPTTESGGRYIKWLLGGFLFVIVLAYLIQAVSPLRINTDSYRLLSMAVSASQGGGYLVDGQPDQFPLAYPFVVKVLLQTGMASSMSLIVLNLLCLLIGLLVLYVWGRRTFGTTRATLSIVLVLSSWVMVKHVTIPLTDLLYFGVSMLSLYVAGLFGKSTGQRKWPFLVIAVLLGYVAAQCRTIGVILFPTLMAAMLLHKEVSPYVIRPLACTPNRALLVGTVTVCMLLLSLGGILVAMQTDWFESQFIRQGSYFQKQISAVTRIGIMGLLLQNVRYRILEFGQVFSNIPLSKMPQLAGLQYAIGLTGWALVFHGARLFVRTRHLVSLPLYFLFYTALMITWPYYAPRFWLPLLPILTLFVLRSIDHLATRWRTIRMTAICYVPVFVMLGLVALLFSTRISWSGIAFSERYGDGSNRMTYRYAFGSVKEVDRHQVDQGKLHLLQTFEPLARNASARPVATPPRDAEP